MSKQVSYDYAHGDLLDNRNTYQYSKFHGQDFLRAWIRQRNAACLEMGEPISPPDPIEHVYVEFEPPYITTLLLEGIFFRLQAEKKFNLKDQTYLKTLVKKYEVSKRLFKEYNHAFQAADKTAYYDLGLYLRFAEVVESAYSFTDDLVYLNVLLKVIDVLIAYKGQLDETQKSRLGGLIQQEQKHVTTVARKNKVELCF